MDHQRQQPQDALRPLEGGEASPAVVQHIDDLGQKGVGVRKAVAVVAWLDTCRKDALLFCVIEKTGDNLLCGALIDTAEEPSADDLRDFILLDGGVNLLDPAGDLL